MRGNRVLRDATSGSATSRPPAIVEEPNPALHLRLFGPIEARLGEDPLPPLRSRKGLWLLALLALRGGRSVDRDWLAGTLWPLCDELHARRSLRQTLHDLRLALGAESWRLASDEPRSIRLVVDGASVDVLEFDLAVERGDPVSLIAAARLYRGPLLEDCAEEWALEGRRTREETCIGLLERLAGDEKERDEPGRTAGWLAAARALDPYREDLLRGLMKALAADGNGVAALIAYREYRALLGRQLAGDPSEETAALFRQIREECRAGAPPWSVKPREAPETPAASRPGNTRTLPIALTELIGRERDVREIIIRLSHARMVTLTGAGGVGKTRLAIKVAEEVAHEFPDGAVFVDLAPLENPDLVGEAVRSALGAPAGEASQDPVENLCDYLSARKTLLILDNCEHLLPACMSLADALLSRCAGLRILATSRQVLSARGESVWRVPSLAVPKSRADKVISLADVRHISNYLNYAAVRLFSERARAAESTFEMSRKNAVAVITICSRLDGIPLAIELAAARVKAMPVEKIAARLIDRFRILMGDRRSLPFGPLPRHQTLRASIDWSYELLSEQEQILSQRLAVFAGGWTLESAEEICSGNPIQEWAILELLTGLVEKSLVAYDPEQDRYRLLETIRQYLAERLEEEGARPALAAKHLDHFAAMAESGEFELTGPGQTRWMDRLECEHDNLRAALAWAGRKNADTDAGLRLSGALWRFWNMRGHAHEGRGWLALLLNAEVARPPTRSRAKALFGAGELAFHYGDINAARALQEECLASQTCLGDLPGIARALYAIGNAALLQGDTATAASRYEKGLAISRELGDLRLIAAGLNNLGLLATDNGEIAAARRFQEENLGIRRELGDQHGIAIALNNLATVAQNEGDYVGAKRLHTECLAHRQRLSNVHGIAVTRSNLGNVALLLGDFHESRALLAESVETLWELGDKTSVASTIEPLASARSAMGELLVAAVLWGAAQRLREEIGVPIAPDEIKMYEERVAAARFAAGGIPFDAAWREGRAMDTRDAVAIAMNRDQLPAR